MCKHTKGKAKRKTICLDFDGVIHLHRGKWFGPDIIGDSPVPGVTAAIGRLRKHFKVVIFSGRCNWPQGIEAIKRWLNDWNIIVDEVLSCKPNAHIFVDDRGLQFNGSWEQCIKDIKAFKQWQS